jgi:hypothetical protein
MVLLAVSTLLATFGTLYIGFGYRTACTDEPSHGAKGACRPIEVAWRTNFVVEAALVMLAVAVLVAAMRRRPHRLVAAIGTGVAVIVFGAMVALANTYRRG